MSNKPKEHIKVSLSEVPVYEPPGHHDTFNRRLAGPFNGSNNVEFIIGEMGKTGDADPHTHHGFDQLMFILEGELRITSPATGKEAVFAPGDLVIFPDGVEHKVVVESEKSRFVVVYGPPKQHQDENGNWVH